MAISTIRTGIALLLSLLLLAGCSEESEPAAPVTLIVGYDSQWGFDRSFRESLQAEFPDYQLQVVEMPAIFDSDDEATYQAILAAKPDLITINSVSLYQRLAKEGRLQAIDGYAAEDNFDLHAFYPNYIEKLRDWGDGRLYGLSSNLNNEALYYNRSLFDRYGVPYPTDRMTWRELLNTINRFPAEGEGDSRIYGLYNGGLNNLGVLFGGLVELMAGTRNITELQNHPHSYVNAKVGKIEIHTAYWKDVITQALDAYRQERMALRADTETNLFLQGKAALTYESAWFVDDLLAAGPDFEWGVVPAPADDSGNQAWSPGMLWAVSAESRHKEAAWDVLRFLHGKEQMAKSPLLSTRTEYLAAYKNTSMLPFYGEDPASGWTNGYTVHGSFLFWFKQQADRKLQSVLAQELSLDDALFQLEQEAQLEYDRIVKRDDP